MNSPRIYANSGKVVGGLIVVTVGVIFLLRQMGYLFPYWLFTWPMILIIVGLINGAKHGFRNPGWLILVALGFAFLLDHIYPIYHISRYTWPILIIGVGLFMIFSRHRSGYERRYGRQQIPDNWSNRPNSASVVTGTLLNQTDQPTLEGDPSAALSGAGEFIDVTAMLGGVKRNIFSKNIIGADITAFMGGAELNFTQADIQGRVVMDISLIMGGCKLIVPSNWTIVSEVTTILGGIEDKRNLAPSSLNQSNKTLILKGTALMGGIEIQSYI